MTICIKLGDWPPVKGSPAVWRALPVSDKELSAVRELLDLDEAYILDITSDPRIKKLNCSPFADLPSLNAAAEALSHFTPEQLQAVSAFCQHGEDLCEAVRNVANGAYRFWPCAEEPEGDGVYIQTEDGFVQIYVPQS